MVLLKVFATFLFNLGLCIASNTGGHPRPNPAAKPFTCAKGQPGADLPFCNRALGFAARSHDLATRLNITEHINLFFSYPGTPWIERLNLKGWSLDHTCIHGLNKAHGVTVFPHAIAQGASWDVDLVSRVSNATALEARILSEQSYAATGGQNEGVALSCDGGPLANSAHDPRWGRISETYGEDPFHIRTIGVAVMQALQNPQPVVGGHPEDRFLATRQVTRHYIGYHGGSGDTINGTKHQAFYNATNRSLADSYYPTYGAYMRPDKGAADGIMCAMTELNGVPSCANPLLMTTMLREQWASDAIIQTDCCDSVQTIAGMKYRNLTKPEALALAVNDGLGIYFGYWVKPFRQWMAENLANGTIAPATVRAAGERVLLSHMKLGFYDNHLPDFPFGNASTPWSSLDSPGHRLLAREAAAKSVVLLKNDPGVLPWPPPGEKGAPQSIAIVGPFAECEGTASQLQGRGPPMNGTCYLHSYYGGATAITTVRQAITQAAGNHTKVSYARGSNATCGWRCGGNRGSAGTPCWGPGTVAASAIAEAVSVARSADATVLVLGAGATVEGEGCDRFNMTLPPVQQALHAAVAKVAEKLVLVLVSAGGVVVDESKASAVLWAPYGGEEAGSGVADVLWGRTNPSARLPLTWYSQQWFEAMNNNVTTSMLNLNLEVGLGRTHRYLDPSAPAPLQPVHHFGFGLSYTSFRYSDLKVQKQVGQSGTDIVATVTLTNTGSVEGAEVVQMYLIPPSQAAAGAPSVLPRQNLVSFRKVNLQPQASATVTLHASSEDLLTATDAGERMMLPGLYTACVGGHLPHDPEAERAGLAPVLKQTIQL